MQKIEINNFGPIKHAEIVLKPLLILIGEQASGKSTIAKLIYFFKSLGNLFLNTYYNSSNLRLNLQDDVIFPFRDKFYDMFGSTLHLPDFKISFWYDDNRFIELSLTERKRLKIHLSDSFFTPDVLNELAGYKRAILDSKAELETCDSPVEKVAIDQKQLIFLRKMATCINTVFHYNANDALYILAGRNATVGYSDFFEKMLSINLSQNIQEQGNRAFLNKEQTIDETLMLEFMERVTKMRQILTKGGNFEGIIHHASKVKRRKLAKAYNLIKEIIRGQYANSGDSERIVFNGGKFIYLKNASSGQQESIRILQDAFLSLYSENNILRIIEEPEAHLYPKAQYVMLKLLTMVLNCNPQNQIIITTHSPYVLAVFNNLMYAHQVGIMHPEKTEAVLDKDFRLNPESVSAYWLKKMESEDIIDQETNLIKAEKIDTVSEELTEQYNTLLNIEFDD